MSNKDAVFVVSLDPKDLDAKFEAVAEASIVVKPDAAREPAPPQK